MPSRKVTNSIVTHCFPALPQVVCPAQKLPNPVFPIASRALVPSGMPSPKVTKAIVSHCFPSPAPSGISSPNGTTSSVSHCFPSPDPGGMPSPKVIKSRSPALEKVPSSNTMVALLAQGPGFCDEAQTAESICRRCEQRCATTR